MNSWFRRRRCTAAALAWALALYIAITGAAVFADPTLVPPGQDERDLNARRTAWIEAIHRAAPGTDWRQIESANRLETMLVRQELQGQAAATAGWTERGAANLTGRNFDAALGSDGLLYVGSANGGLFRRAPAGSGSWTPLMDDVGYGIQHVVALGGPPPRLVVADNSRIFTSSNGGATWFIPTGLPDYIWTVVRLVREANNATTVYALVEGWIWTGVDWDHNWHLLRSDDAGASFARVYTIPIATRPDMWISRTGAGPLYLAAGNQLIKSVDHGVTFTPVGTFPHGSDRAQLAGSEAGAPAFYCALQSAGAWNLFASTNGGASWLDRGTLGDFYGTLFAPITDPSQVFVGGVDCYRSLDYGATLTRMNYWYEYYGDPQTKLHADIFGLSSTYAAAVERIYIHTDGGTYALAPGGATPDNVTRIGFHNAQYYGTLTSHADPDHISAGAQDQGYQISNAGLGTVVPDFTQVISGDYAHLTSSWVDRSRMIFSVYPAFVLVQTGTGDAPGLETTNFPSGAPGFQFLPAITADPTDPNAAYVGARQIWRVRRDAPGVYSWVALAHDFDHGDGDIVGAIAMAPSQPARRYVVTYHGRLYYSTNSGASWNESIVTGPPSHYFAGSDIAVSSTDPLTAWVAGSGYSNPGVYRTTDGGASWSPMAAGLPSTQAYAIALDDVQSPFVATQAGPFRWNGSAWDNLLLTTCCAPLTDYWDVEYLPNRALMRFSTYGRGIWDYATGSALAAPAAGRVDRLAIGIAPNPAEQRSIVSFSLPTAGRVRVDVFDVRGRMLRTLSESTRSAGRQTLAFDHRDDEGRPLRSGLYLIRLRTATGVAVGRMTIAR